MKESNQNSRDHEDDTVLDIDGIEDSIHLELETADLLLEQWSLSQDSHDTEGDIVLVFEVIEDDDTCTPFTFDSSPD